MTDDGLDIGLFVATCSRMTKAGELRAGIRAMAAERRLLLVELAELRQLCADRDADLQHEYERANAAEAEAERLRAEQDRQQQEHALNTATLQAALEQTHAENARLQTLADNATHNAGQAQHEIARLRAALEAVEFVPDGMFGDAICAWCYGNGSHDLNCQRQAALSGTPSPADDTPTCGDCGQPLTPVRPGKWQCDRCGD